LKPQSYAPRVDHIPRLKIGNAPHFLMCPPRYFGVRYRINPWMDPEAWSKGEGSLKAVAEQQWTSLHEVLTSRGADVTFLRCKPDLPDLVFTANAAVILDGVALLSRFRHSERQAEQPIVAAAFRRLVEQQYLAAVFELPPNVTLEGAGDCIWDQHRRLFWVGCGPRSTRDAGRAVAACFGVEAVSLELADARFYHLDTALCALPTGELIYYPEAFTEAGLREIEARVEPSGRLALTHEEATQFAANAVYLDGCVLMSRCSERLRRELEGRGIEVIETPLDAFWRSGGSACCLTLRLDHSSGDAARVSSHTAATYPVTATA